MKNYFSIETLLSEILAVGMSIKILIVSNFFKDDLLIHVKGINLLDTVSTKQYCFLKNGPVSSCVLLMHICTINITSYFQVTYTWTHILGFGQTK